MCGFRYWSSEKEDMIHLICHVISQYHVIKVSFTIFLHPVTFGCHRNCNNRDTKFLICRITSEVWSGCKIIQLCEKGSYFCINVPVILSHVIKITPFRYPFFVLQCHFYFWLTLENEGIFSLMESYLHKKF